MVGFAVSALPLVSVCIANYNGSEMISGCIESVLGQDFDFPFEILVHDDASTDNSAEVVARGYPDVRLIRSESNVGFCVANNRMVAQAKGAYILLLNNDAELQQDALRALFDEAKAVGKPAILSLPQYDYSTGKLIDRGCLLDPFFNPVPNLDPQRREVAMVIGACFWIPKQLWDELGGFPEWFGSIAEDMYLCCRARLAGYLVRVLSVSGYRHWQGKSFGGNRVVDGHLTTTIKRRALSERNKSFVFVLTHPSPTFWFLFPLHLLLLIIEGVALTLFKRSVAVFSDIYFFALKSLWCERVRLCLLRSQLQKRRHIGRWGYFEVFRCFPQKLRLLLKHGVPHIS